MDITHFEILYKTYQPGLVNFAYFYLKNEQEAIDTVQELFMNLWEKKEDFIVTDNPKAYLMTAVKNRCFNKLSRNKLQQNTLNTLQDVFISPDTTLTSFEAKETETNINNAIENLPLKCREIFILSRFEHLSYKEISLLLNLSVKTVENQISIALKLLRKSITIILILIINDLHVFL